MRLITIVTLLLCMLLVPGFAYGLTGQSEQPQITHGYPAPKILCLNHKVSDEFADVTMSPVYDWVHGGQQGINFTVTNKTNENIVIDWDKTLYHRRTAGEVAEDWKAPSMEATDHELYDVVAPGATFSKTLWPRADAWKLERLENRNVHLTARANKGIEQHEEITLNVSGEQRLCSI
jgi:hypothetical protein